MAQATARRVAIDWPERENVHGGRALWFAAWLTGDAGTEGAAFYSGRGGERVVADIPATATGIRVYRWLNEGLDPGYCDAGFGDRIEDLDFDRPQRFSRLRLHDDDRGA